MGINEGREKNISTTLDVCNYSSKEQLLKALNKKLKTNSIIEKPEKFTVMVKYLLKYWTGKNEVTSEELTTLKKNILDHIIKNQDKYFIQTNDNTYFNDLDYTNIGIQPTLDSKGLFFNVNISRSSSSIDTFAILDSIDQSPVTISGTSNCTLDASSSTEALRQEIDPYKNWIDSVQNAQLINTSDWISDEWEYKFKDAESINGIQKNGKKYTYDDGNTVWQLSEMPWYYDQFPRGRPTFELIIKDTKNKGKQVVVSMEEGDNITLNLIKSKIKLAQERLTSEERDEANIKRFTLPKDQVIGYIALVDSAPDVITQGIIQDSNNFPKLLSDQGHNIQPVRIKRDGPNYLEVTKTKKPAVLLRKALRQLKRDNITHAYIDLVAHGLDDGIYFQVGGGNYAKITPDELKSIFKEFGDMNITFNTIACNGGGIENMVENFTKNGSGTLHTFFQSKQDGSNQEGRLSDKRENGSPKVFSTYYNIFRNQGLIKGMGYGEAHLYADKLTKEYIGVDASALVNHGSSNNTLITKDFKPALLDDTDIGGGGGENSSEECTDGYFCFNQYLENFPTNPSSSEKNNAVSQIKNHSHNTDLLRHLRLILNENEVKIELLNIINKILLEISTLAESNSGAKNIFIGTRIQLIAEILFDLGDNDFTQKVKKLLDKTIFSDPNVSDFVMDLKTHLNKGITFGRYITEMAIEDSNLLLLLRKGKHTEYETIIYLDHKNYTIVQGDLTSEEYGFGYMVTKDFICNISTDKYNVIEIGSINCT